MTSKTPLDAISSLSAAIAQSGSPTEVYNLILDTVINFLGVDKASIMVFDPAIDGLRIVAARGMDDSIMRRAIVRIGEGISGRVFANHKPIMINDITASEMGPGKDRYSTKSLISAPVTCFPMKVGEDALGVINVTDRKKGGPFTDKDLQLLTTLANQAAAFLHILRLVEESHANERLREQLEIARQIQYRLLPSGPPSVEGLDVAGRLITAERVGGDYYDCFLTHTNKPAFVIADVSGHSIGAALIMAAFRAAIKSQMDADITPANLTQKINSILYEDLFQAEQFISMIYLKYERAAQNITYSCAGHLPPIVMHSNGKVSEFDTGDSLLGIELRSNFHEKQITLSEGDVVLLYTDGIVEAANKDGERFGRKRLVECLSDACVGSARQIVDVLVESVQAFVDPEPVRDDVTALVLKVK